MTTEVTYLFVPASRPERFQKAIDSGADAVIVDLEDAVALEDKESSLQHLIDALNAGLSAPVHVRINAPDSPWFERDVAALEALKWQARRHLAGVVVPKAEFPESLQRVREVIDEDKAMVALIESAVGVAWARELGKVPGLSRFAVGAADLSFDLDVEISSTTVDWVYATLVLESRLAGLPGPIGSPSFEIQDQAAVEAEAKRLRGLGAGGQLCIHPGQLEAVRRGFAPSAQQVEWAREVLAAAGGGAAQVGGQMVDKPVRERAERILARVES